MTLLATKEELEAELDRMHAEVDAAVRAIAERYEDKGLRVFAMTVGMCREDLFMRTRSAGNMSTRTLHSIFVQQLEQSCVAKVIVVGDAHLD